MREQADVDKHRETIRYLLVGVLTSGVNLAVFFLLKDLWGMNYLLSNGIAWIATVLVAYVANKWLVFGSDCHSIAELIHEFVRFVNSRLFSGTADLLLMWVLVGQLGWESAFVKLLNSAVVVALNYVFSRLIFKQKTL